MRRISLLATTAACLSLSACGGGGVNSTPTPSTTPTPTPTPTPAQTNSSLTNLQFSESFTNDAATGITDIPTNQSGVSSASQSVSQLAIGYDVTNSRYSISVQGRSQAFGPADKLASESNEILTTYQVKNGSTTDSLSLTNPGSSGIFQQRYVAAGFWQRTQEQKNTIHASFDAFSYGVETPDAGVPRSGSAAYAFGLLGVSVHVPGDIPASAVGTGRILIDFLTGQLVLKGTIDEIDIISGSFFGSGQALNGNGQLSSTRNALTGTISYDFYGKPFSGSLNGRLYGPAGEEIGASINANNADGGAFVAALVGENDPSGTGLNFSLLSLDYSQEFLNRGGLATYKLAQSSNTINQFTTSIGNPLSFSYDKAGGSYRLQGGGFGSIMSPVTEVYDASQLQQTGDPRFVSYQKTDGNGQTRLTFFVPGAQNSDLALTYTSFGVWSQLETPDSNGLSAAKALYFTYGTSTAVSMPHSGTGSFSGKLYGTAGSSAQGSDLYSLTGSTDFHFDFAKDSFTGSLTPIGRNMRTNATLSYGTFTFDRGSMALFSGSSLTSAGFGADIGSNGTPVGTIRGDFYGPAATELGGIFNISIPDGANAGQLIMMTGAVVAKRN